MTYTALSVLAVFYLLGCSTASHANPEENFAVHSKRCSFGGCSDLIGGSIKTLPNTDGAPAPTGSEGAADLTASPNRSNSGSISPLTDAAARPADVVEVNRQLKRCSSSSVNIEGNNSGAITIVSAPAAKQASPASEDPFVPAVRRVKRCSFAGCRVSSGSSGSKVPDAAAQPAGGASSQAKRSSSGGNHVRVDGNNSGAISVLAASATQAKKQSVPSSDVASSHSQQRKHRSEINSGHIKMQSVQDSEPVGAETSQPRLKRCSFGSCTVIIDGNNSGAINLRMDEDCTVSISGTNSGAITGAHCVEQGVAVQATDASGSGYDGSRYASRLTYTTYRGENTPSKKSSSGPCIVDIQGDNSQAINLK